MIRFGQSFVNSNFIVGKPLEAKCRQTPKRARLRALLSEKAVINPPGGAEIGNSGSGPGSNSWAFSFK